MIKLCVLRSGGDFKPEHVGFILPYVKDAQRWQDIYNVYSYKYHCKRGIPADADVVCWHGKPRPWECGF